MASGKIALRSVAALKAPKVGDDYLWDSELGGFGVKVTAAGKKVYLVQYRMGGRNGRTRRYTIGKHGSPWTPDTARQKAKEILGEVANGIDPAERKTAARQDLTVSQLCDLYLKEGIALKKASTADMDRIRIEAHVNLDWFQKSQGHYT